MSRWYLGTSYETTWNPPAVVTHPLVYLRGQREICPTTSREHWQLLATFSRQVRIPQVKQLVCNGHWEPSRSQAARNYVWKDLTAVEGTRFEVGAEPVRRNCATDWDAVRSNAVAGKLSEIPADIYIRYYRSLCAIASDNAQPIAIVREVFVFWGATGTGKSKRAWEEAGVQAYSKDPRSKWWCGYRDQVNVIIDEFRGGIDISHILRWTDRYPVSVETKGSSKPLLASKIWITSNLDPRLWYPDLDADTLAALLRRVNIIHFNYFFPKMKNAKRPLFKRPFYNNWYARRATRYGFGVLGAVSGGVLGNINNGLAGIYPGASYGWRAGTRYGKSINRKIHLKRYTGSNPGRRFSSNIPRYIGVNPPKHRFESNPAANPGYPKKIPRFSRVHSNFKRARRKYFY